MLTKCVTRRTFVSTAALVTVFGRTPSYAANWPTRTISLVVPFAPGGPVDPPARMIAEHLSSTLSQRVIVESRPGAAGAIGARAVAHASDGHTFLFFTGSLATLPSLQRELNLDIHTDLTPISLLSETPMAFAVLAGSPIRDAADLLERARKDPKKISYGSSGNGSTTHLAWLLLQIRTNLEFLHVPYRGASASLNGLYTGEIDAVVGDLSLLLPHVADGKLRLLAVTTEQPISLAPGIPTMDSIVGNYNIPIWHCLLGPRATPPDIVEVMLREISHLRQGSLLQKRLESSGGRLILSTPEVLSKRLHDEELLWRQVLLSAGIQPA